MVKKILKWITNILTIILLLILTILIYTKCVTTFSRSAYPNYFGYTILEVASGSMEPTLKIHDVVLVKIGNDDIKKDDIIAYQDKDSIITHRIIFMDNDNLTVKGDANNTVDDAVSRSAVIGKVVKIYKELGIWKNILTEPKIIIVLFITLILFDVALSYKGKEEKGKKEKKSKEEDVKIEKIQGPKEAEKEELLEFTRKIDLAEINAMLDKEEVKLSEKEIKNLKENISKIEKDNMELPKLKEKEKKFLEYTMRLDLNEIQKRIKKEIK